MVSLFTDIGSEDFGFLSGLTAMKRPRLNADTELLLCGFVMIAWAIWLAAVFAR